MAWARRNRRRTAWVAIFALALQVVLSFGHVHRAALVAPAAAALASYGDDDSPSPQHRGHANDICPVCATLGLTATSILPTAASLALPASRQEGLLAGPHGAQASFDLPSFFQARAPPALS